MRIDEVSSEDLGMTQSDTDHTIGLIDDRRTEEVLRDLGFIRDGLCQDKLSLFIQLCHCIASSDDQIGENIMDLLVPPRFGPKDSMD